VELSTGCHEDGSAIEQVHRFVLRQSSGEWVFARRELTSIS
jgi:hypothetical protein